MEGREAERGEIERLAELKAKRKMEGWEQFKSPWPFFARAVRGCRIDYLAHIVDRSVRWRN